jgi:hypothetical protein
MGYVIAAIAAVAVIGLYGWACVYAFVWVALPLSVIAGAVGIVGGAAVALLVACLAWAGRRPEIKVTGPDAVARGAIGGPPQPPGHPRRDLGWPTYFTVQYRHDLTGIGRWTAEIVGEAWASCARAAARISETWWTWLIVWPIALPILVFLGAMTLGALLGAVLCLVVVLAVTAVAWLLGGAVTGLLRGVDLLWQKVFRAVASCPSCYYVTGLPAYRCSCGTLHRDMRPGKLGVLWRRCGGRSATCGRRLPTTVLRAARVMVPVCQRCDADLRKNAAVATDIRIPVFGATMAGKTRLIAAGLVLLKDAAGGRASFVDRESEKTYHSHRTDFHGDRPMPKTSASDPVAMTLDLVIGRRHALVHIFDAAGELLVDRTANASLSYLDQARTLMFVLDPFSIPDVRQRLVGGLAGVLAEANPSPHDTESSYNSTVQRLRDSGVDTHRRRLAFVVSKADLLARLPESVGLRLTDPERWLHDRGLDNLLLSARRDFGEVRIFVVSSMGRTPNGVATALDPLRWLLAGEGITV